MPNVTKIMKPGTAQKEQIDKSTNKIFPYEFR